MLEAWMNQEEEPTWSKIVAALREMKKTALAEQIASKFGGSILKKHSVFTMYSSITLLWHKL